MTWLFILLAMAVIALAAGVVTGRIAGSMEPPASSLPFRGLPPEGVVPADLVALRFDAALRGYRMDEVDTVIDRLAFELRSRDEEIAELRATLADVQSASESACQLGQDGEDEVPAGVEGRGASAPDKG